MAVDWSAYERYIGVNGDTKRERSITRERESFRKHAVRNAAYRPDAMRNGSPQELLAIRSDVQYKYTVVAFPGDDLFVGDILEFEGEHWIVQETRVAGAFYTSGIAWLCNHLFRFQNGTSTIYERWGVLDSGVYSTTQAGSLKVRYPDKQFRIYLPYDDATKKIYVDKRIAVDTMYDKRGNEILEVYTVTGRNRVARSYGTGAHLLILECRGGGDFYRGIDNVEEIICDYIEPGTEPPVIETTPHCEIMSGEILRTGGRLKATALFYDAHDELAEGIVPIWGVTAPTGVVYSVDEAGVLTLTARDAAELIGEEVVIALSEASGDYLPCTREVEVDSYA